MPLARLWHDWSDIVGRDLARQTRPGGRKNGILFVHVRDSVWAEHLKWVKKDLIKRIDQKVGGGSGDFVTDIIFRHGPPPGFRNWEETSTEGQNPNHKNAPPSRPRPPVNPELWGESDVATQLGEDPLREAIFRAVLAQNTRDGVGDP